MRSEVVALVVAGVANAAGAIVALVMWRRRRRRHQVARSPHPSARPPVQLALAPGSEALEVSVPSGAPEIAVDILSVRRLDPPGSWEPAQLDEPVVVAPGGRVEIALESVPAGRGTGPGRLDVVVAWTARHATGDVPGSRLFRLPPDRDAPASSAPGGLGTLATVALLALLAASTAIVVGSLRDADDGRSSGAEPSPATAELVPLDVGDAAPPATSATSLPTAGSTIAASSPPAVTTSTTAAPAATPTTTTTTTTTTTLPDDAPTVEAVGRIESCRFGDACLVVGFTIAGFDDAPGEYACEFDDGSRFTFGFVGDGADTACSTGDPGETIVVEVGGVRSDTVSRGDVVDG